MAIKLADTLAPMADFPAVMAEHTAFEDGETLQEKYETGQLGGGGSGYTQLSQADYDALSDDEKMNGKEYRTYDTGHIYRLGVEYGKDADISRSEVLRTYTTITDLNTIKGTSVTLVAGEDNTIAIIDALDAREQFIEWFNNGSASTDRFGIDNSKYGKKINELKIVKMTATDASAIAVMDSGVVLSRVYTNGTLGAWCVKKENTTGLISNAQNFKIDITKNNSYWYGFFTFSFSYGTTICEITVSITTEVYYTITKGQNVVSAITYTRDGANYIIGIDFIAKMYGTQVVDMPSEFGTINSLTAEQFAGDTTATCQGSYSMKSYVALSELGLDTTATINDIIGAMVDGSVFMYKTDVFDYATEYNNIQYGTVTIHKQSGHRVQVLMTDKDTGNLYVGRMNNTNKIVKWAKMITDMSDPYACTSYTALTGTEDLFTLPCGHYASDKISTAYNYPITDSSNVLAHIYVLGHLNDPTNNKGYRIILYFDNKGRAYRINEWWGSFSNSWQEIITKEYVDSKIADLQAQINALK